MSFLKQLPPNPGPESRNLEPILESVPIALATSCTSAPVDSQRAAIEFIELIRWARKAFAVNLANSLLQILVFKILFSGTHFLYISFKQLIAS